MGFFDKLKQGLSKTKNSFDEKMNNIFSTFRKADEELLEDGTTREIMHFLPSIAPYKVAILPLVKKYHSEYARELKETLSKNFMCMYDESGSIGKRYRREDAIGTPFCITVDDETLNNNIVTIRNRDTMEQEKINVDEIENYISSRIKF